VTRARARERWEAAAGTLRTHPRHAALAALVGGLLLGPASPALALAAAALAAVLVTAATPRPGLGLLVAAAVLAGAVAADARLAALDRTVLRPVLGQTVSTRAVLVEPARRGRSGGVSALVRLRAPPGVGERVLVRFARRLGGAWGSGSRQSPVRLPGVPVGAELGLRGRLVPLRPRDGFARRRGAHAVLVAFEVWSTGRRRGGLAGALDRARTRAERGLAAGLPPAQAALLRGMVLGQDEALTEPVREEFRRSGLAHLLAASGQNVMLLAALTLPVLTAAGVGRRSRLLAVLALIAVYVPLAGAGPSIQRAGIMGAAGLVAALAGTPASRWYALLLAAAATLLIDPRAAGDPGWQLSFAAVVAILALAPRMREALAARRVPSGVADAAAITLAATIGTAPLLAHHFGRLSLASLPANLLAAIAVAPLMWLGMVSGALGQIDPAAGTLVNALNQYLLGYLGWLAHVAAGAPASSVPVRLDSVPALVAAYAGLAMLVAAGRRWRRPVLAVAAVAMAALVAAARPPPPPPPPGGLTVSFLDIGQGDATLIQDGGAAILVDAGPPGGPILARLREEGVRRLDVLVVTHSQSDHEGGAAAVLRRYPVGLLLDGGTRTREHAAILAEAARRGVRRAVAQAGVVVRTGALRMRILWPEPGGADPGADPNERAVVAHLQARGLDLLLPADAESNVTAALPLLRAEAIKVAHHGSADTGLPELLARVRPEVAVIEVGARNTYGHPTPETLGALRAVPRVYRTDRDGTVRLTAAGGRMTVTTAR